MRPFQPGNRAQVLDLPLRWTSVPKQGTKTIGRGLKLTASDLWRLRFRVDARACPRTGLHRSDLRFLTETADGTKKSVKLRVRVTINRDSAACP